MGMNELISVIILSYKNTKEIYPTVDSILKQKYGEIEIVISDDGTPGFADEEEKIKSYIHKHSGKNIKNVIINGIKVNGGTVKNINSALKLSNGAYIKVLSAEDCFSTEDALDKYYQFLCHSDFQICFAKLRGVLPNGEYKYVLPSCESDYDLLKSYSVEQTRNRLYARDFLPTPAWFAKKSLFEQYGYFKEDTRLMEDYPYWFHLTNKGVAFGYLDEVLIDYKLSGVSSSGNYSEMFMNDMLVVYNKYIFPYDKRYGKFQRIYNFLKKAGLNFYMTKARWSKLSKGQKICAYLKYWIFYLYTWILEMKNNWENANIKK